MNPENLTAGRQREFHNRADMDRADNRCNNPYIRKRERMIAGKILDRANSDAENILEIGCGEGTNLLYLNEIKSDCKYTGIDFSKEKIDAFQGFPENIRGVVADATDLPFPEREFDIVFIRDVLHHIDWARNEVIREAWRVLKPGGSLLVFEGNPYSPLNIIFRFLYSVEKGMKNSSRKQIFALLKQYGPCSIEYLEAGYLVRAISFVVWKSGSRNILGRFLLPLCDIVEKSLYFMPTSFWPCRLYIIKKTKTNN